MKLCPCCGKPKKPSGLDGLGTALKPAVELIVLARKPLSEPSIAANVLRWGTGALAIDRCRVEGGESTIRSNEAEMGYGGGNKASSYQTGSTAGRWPPNLAHDGSPEVQAAFDLFGAAGSNSGTPTASDGTVHRNGHMFSRPDQAPSRAKYDTRGASAARFFPSCPPTAEEPRFHYSAKAGRDDRAGSNHPTVKPLTLMRWLVRLVTPPGGTVLDCFAGTGVTAEAALLEGFRAVLIEKEEEHFRDCLKRLGRAAGEDTPLFSSVPSEELDAA